MGESYCAHDGIRCFASVASGHLEVVGGLGVGWALGGFCGYNSHFSITIRPRITGRTSQVQSIAKRAEGMGQGTDVTDVHPWTWPLHHPGL